MKSLIPILLLLFLNRFPEQIASLEACRDVLVYSASTDSGHQYYQFDINQQTEIELPFDNLASAPMWSPDGNLIAIATNNESDGFDLAILTGIDDEPIRIASGRATQPKIRWSPDSNWIAFESQNNVYVITPTGEEYRQITQGDMFYFLGDWSPNGQALLVSANDIDKQNMVVISIETEDYDEITHPVEGVFDYFVSWTPDSGGILFSTNRFSDKSALYRLNMADETPELYIDSVVVSVSWNPSGTRFVFSVSSNGFIEIYTHNLLTGENVMLTGDYVILHENFVKPVWSPSGSFIAFTAIDDDNHENEYEVFVADLEAGKILQLTSNNRIESSPTWLSCRR
ncbi:MAG: DPP IV N-terminal domain-containing protein [Anaerolineae bacterium]|nr:DPP IV N-terminal domain-containing protein [Anaerolineae bacterium]